MPVFRAKEHSFELGLRPYVMGILNVTPDSFSDGGLNYNPEQAISRAREMIDEGADIIDIGGESTRPNGELVSASEEKQRIIPVIEAVSKMGAVISVDTFKPEVALAAANAGASIINDIFGLQGDGKMGEVVAQTGCGVILMHNRTLYSADTGPRFCHAEQFRQLSPHQEQKPSAEACLAFLQKSLQIAQANQINSERIMLDAGVGFGTTVAQGQSLIAATAKLRALGYPVLAAVSRKRLIQTLATSGHHHAEIEYDWATALVHAHAVTQGADFVRVHNVKLHKAAMDFIDVIAREEK